MANQTINTKIETFHKLHLQSSTFILPNAWNPISAKMFQDSGFKAIGTTSAGIAIALGYPDGQKLPVQKMIDVTKDIVDAVDVPVSADIEAGYGNTVEDVLDTVKRVMDVGVVGINIEDGTGDPNEPIAELSYQMKVIEAIRELSHSTYSRTAPFFINARTDFYWLNIGSETERFVNTIERAKAFEQAGADCIFIPGVSNEQTIRELRSEISKPINLLAGPNMPTVQELSDLKIERLSCGSGPFRAVATLIRAMSDEMMNDQTFNLMNDGTLSYQEIANFIEKLG